MFDWVPISPLLTRLLRLGWAVKLKSEIPFLGREAADATVKNPRRKLLCCFTVDDPDVVLSGRETILRNGKPVGYISSAGWGYTLGKNIGHGYCRNDEGVDRRYLKGGLMSARWRANS